ncbi:MAG TPA: signal recognition particle-docking protein FtsY [Myxococcota bacterium]|nr:signal recognition particle-docking protein FtsY [Myxococcota bacterium]HQK52085.1 signal recognition particle-docking protein FtsY [Myxococcota bacterium]
MEPSAIFVLVLVLGFAVLVALAASRMSRKKRLGRGIEQPETPEVEAPPVRPEPPRETPREPVPEPPRAATGRKAEQKPPPPSLVVEVPAARPLGAGLERTRKEGFVARLMSSFGRETLDEAFLAQAEEVLLTADVGVRTAGDLVEALRREFRPAGGDLGPQVLAFLQQKTLQWLEPLPHGAPEAPGGAEGPGVIMVVGVNGTGKTTTIGKMARFYRDRGRKVLLCAGDTYRAAGMDQLAIWGERVGVPVVVGNPGQDPGSLMFDAAKKARQDGHDLLIADTAGRLHTNVNLVDELKKIHRVLGKAVPGAPHEVLLVLDATMGQNAVRQADIFRQAVQVSGIVLAKLDGTAKGGVVLSIARDMGLPIRFVGVGEGVEDLRPFDPREFAEALFEPVRQEA